MENWSYNFSAANKVSRLLCSKLTLLAYVYPGPSQSRPGRQACLPPILRDQYTSVLHKQYRGPEPEAAPDGWRAENKIRAGCGGQAGDK